MTVGTLLCPDCQQKMVRIKEPYCTSCGREQPVRGLCGTCAAQPQLLRQVRAPLHYEEPISSVIHLMKYEGYFALAEPLAAMMAQAWPRWATPVDFLVPVPLHTRRRRKRGYDQAALLARHLGRILEIPVAERILERSRHTRPQVGLDAEKRQDNVKGAFSAVGRVDNQHLLLIDDVYTTGATMSAAAETLLYAGAATVSAYCLARAAR